MPVADPALTRCLRLLEADLGWGDAARWSTADFETLSDRIGERTGVHLSPTTLKRVWGRVAYKSSPSPTTLDALAVYLGYENWRSFAVGVDDDKAKVALAAPANVKELELRKASPSAASTAYPADAVATDPMMTDAVTTENKRSRFIPWLIRGAAVLFLAFLVHYLAPAAAPSYPATSATPATSPADYEFRLRPVTEGLPNSVVFTYQADAAPVDSVFIQQSWDVRRRRRVARNGDTHTAIYYRPGYYRATLNVGSREVKSRELLIASDGWVGAIGSEREGNVPIYLSAEALRRDGRLGITADQVVQHGFVPAREPPLVWLSHVGEFRNTVTADFNFTTTLRQTFNRGAAACRNSRVLLLLRNSALIVTLSSPGCAAELSLYAGGKYLDGATTDLTGFGALDGEWTELGVSGQDDLLSFYVNGELVLQLESQDDARDVLGVRYEFEGAGEVASMRLDGTDGERFEENFRLGK